MGSRFSVIDRSPNSVGHGPGMAIAANKVKKLDEESAKPKKRKRGSNLVKKRPEDVSGSLIKKEKPVPAERPMIPAPMLLQELNVEGRRSAKAIMLRLLQDGISPLEVMVENMRWAHTQSQHMLQTIVGEIEAGKVKYEEGREDLFEKFVALMRCREFAQNCARDAATYLHPKLQTIEVKTDDRKAPTVVKRVIIDVDPSTGQWPDARPQSGDDDNEEDPASFG